MLTLLCLHRHTQMSPEHSGVPHMDHRPLWWDIKTQSRLLGRVRKLNFLSQLPLITFFIKLCQTTEQRLLCFHTLFCLFSSMVLSITITDIAHLIYNLLFKIHVELLVLLYDIMHCCCIQCCTIYIL